MGLKTVLVNSGFAAVVLPLIATVTPEKIVSIAGIDGTLKDYAIAGAAFLLAIVNIYLRKVTEDAHKEDLAAVAAGTKVVDEATGKAVKVQ